MTTTPPDAPKLPIPGFPGQQPRAAARLSIAVGDADQDGRTDVCLVLQVAGVDLPPLVLNTTASLGLSLLTSLFDGARRGPKGIAAGALAALLPSLLHMLPGALAAGTGAATALGGIDDHDLDNIGKAD